MVEVVLIGDSLMVDWRFYSLDMLPVNNTRGSKYGLGSGFGLVWMNNHGDRDKKRLREKLSCWDLELMGSVQG